MENNTPFYLHETPYREGDNKKALYYRLKV